MMSFFLDPLPMIRLNAVCSIGLGLLSACRGATPPNASIRSEREFAWQQYSSSEDAGYSSGALEAVRRSADSVGSAALFVVVDGKVVLAWGAVNRPFPIYSIRKSVANALYGISASKGQLRLTATLSELGIDELNPLTAQERSARIVDLLNSRSGVYIDAAYEGEEQHPPRGSNAPGTRFYYGNWGFNVLETVFERVTGTELFNALERDLAVPLGMEDFTRGQFFHALEPTRSRFPAHTMQFSARDLARVGLLYLNGGQWNRRALVPRAWVDSSTSALVPDGGGAHYGYLWKTYPPQYWARLHPNLTRYRVIAATGTDGQRLYLLPELNMVLVHLADRENGVPLQSRVVEGLIDRIIAARIGEPVRDARTKAVEIIPFQSQKAEYVLPPILPITEVDKARLNGRYETQDGARIRVFAHGSSMFLYLPGLGEGELFKIGVDRYTMKVFRNIIVDFEGPSGPAAVVKANVQPLGVSFSGRRVP